VFERRTFIVRFHASARSPILEDVSTGERVQLPDLVALAGELEGRLAVEEGSADEPDARQADSRSPYDGLWDDPTPRR
jgi:hypothetical protein